MNRLGKKLVIVTMLLFVAVTTACATEWIKPSKKIITRELPSLEAFNAIEFGGVGDVVYEVGTSRKVTLTGPDNVLPIVEVKVADNTLKIKFKSKKQVKGNVNLKIRVTAPNVTKFVNTGVGDILVDSKLNVQDEEVKMVVTGVGNIKADNLDVGQLSLTVTGVGDVEVKGKAKRASMKLTGVGDVKAYELLADKVVARLTGVGDINCHAVTELEARTSGVGSVNYKGEPKLTGKGRVHHKD